MKGVAVAAITLNAITAGFVAIFLPSVTKFLTKHKYAITGTKQTKAMLDSCVVFIK